MKQSGIEPGAQGRHGATQSTRQPHYNFLSITDEDTLYWVETFIFPDYLFIPYVYQHKHEMYGHQPILKYKSNIIYNIILSIATKRTMDFNDRTIMPWVCSIIHNVCSGNEISAPPSSIFPHKVKNFSA